MSIALSRCECQQAITKSGKRPLDSEASEYELPPAVKIKNTNPRSECILSVGTEIEPAVDVTTTKMTTSRSDYGNRLIPQLIDERARENPEASVWSVPRAPGFDDEFADGLADGFYDINYGQVARAINAVAWWIQRHIGRSTTFKTVAYMGPPDLRYAIVTIAAQKTGHTVSCRAKYKRAFYLYFLGTHLFTFEQHRNTPAPSRIRKLQGLDRSNHSPRRCQRYIGEVENESYHDSRNDQSFRRKLGNKTVSL